MSNARVNRYDWIPVGRFVSPPNNPMSRKMAIIVDEASNVGRSMRGSDDIARVEAANAKRERKQAKRLTT
jgi:hypothetical protein